MLETNVTTANRRFIGQSDVGLLRSVNQDSYYVDEEAGRFFIVADGMGGHAGGQEASQIAVERISAYLLEHWETDLPTPELLQQAILTANQSILDDQDSHPERGDMGTTVVLIAFRHDGNWRAHIGDSRLYCFRQGQLLQVTEDHTWVARALKMGDLEPDQIKTHPWRHVLFQCLGRQDLAEAEVGILDVKTGDVFLLCSDGLTEEVEEATISEILQVTSEPERIAEALIEAAKAGGGSDNITVILVCQD